MVGKEPRLPAESCEQLDTVDRCRAGWTGGESGKSIDNESEISGRLR